MRVLFADAFFYLALLNSRDAAHDRAAAIALGHRGQMVTTAWVLTEVADAMAAPNDRRAFVTCLRYLRSQTTTTIVPPTQDLFDEGMSLYERRPDKGWSLTDCMSFAVMQDHGITDALTGDRHFEQAGFRAMFLASSQPGIS